MPVFKFKSKNFEGKDFEGKRDAEDQFALARDLKKEGYTLVDFEGETKGKKFSFPFLFFGNVSLSEKVMFTRNLSVMLKAGLPVARAITILVKQSKNKNFKKILSDILKGIEKGQSLSESFAKYKKVFPKLYVSMIKAGEKSGKLEESLRLMSKQMYNTYLLQRKIKGAMVYPIIVLVAMIGIGTLLLIYVVPSLVSTFQELGVELPLSTKIIIWLSNSLLTNSVLIAAVFLAFVAFIFFLLRYNPVRRLKDSVFLYLPLISPIIMKINSARTARTLSSLVDSGVNILEALEITSEVLQNVFYRDVLVAAGEDIQKGSSIASSFRKNERIFPSLMAEMISVGEETGQLSEMLLELATFYEEEVSQATKDMATVIEPILMIFIGAAVGFFAISMIKPMYSMMGGI